MILKEFKSGWQLAFESKIQILFNLFPEISIKSIKRHFGMLKINLSTLDNDTQYVVDCVTYKIERESSKVCEACGKFGIRRKEYLSEMMCLCWKCYAIEIDSMDSRNIN